MEKGEGPADKLGSLWSRPWPVWAKSENEQLEKRLTDAAGREV